MLPQTYESKKILKWLSKHNLSSIFAKIWRPRGHGLKRTALNSYYWMRRWFDPWLEINFRLVFGDRCQISIMGNLGWRTHCADHTSSLNWMIFHLLLRKSKNETSSHLVDIDTQCVVAPKEGMLYHFYLICSLNFTKSICFLCW